MEMVMNRSGIEVMVINILINRLVIVVKEKKEKRERKETKKTELI